MRIASRLTFAFLALGFIAFFIHSLLAVATEEEELREAKARESRLLARSLQVAIENAIRDDDRDDITETLSRLESIEPEVDVIVYRQDGSVRAASEGVIRDAEREDLWARRAMDGRDLLTSFQPDGGLERLIVAAPLRADDGVLLGGLVVGRPLDSLRLELEKMRWAAFWLLVAYTVWATVVGVILGELFVGRPMKRLLSGIRRAQKGGLLGHDLPVERRDEVGLLAREFSLLMEALAVARLERDEAEAGRREMERTLAHGDKLITVGHLTARFAHEIGSPLQVLVGRAEAIRLSGVDEKTERHARIIAEQGQRIVKIVQELLSWAKPNRGTLKPMSPREELSKIRDLLALELRQREIELKVVFAESVPERPFMVFREGQLQQVVFNLLRNAIVVTPAGGEIRLELAKGEEEGERGIVVAVADTGPGFSTELSARLFEPFASTRLDDGGLGLGLAIVRSIVANHGGKVRRVPVERGARIEVFLPIGGEG